MKTKNNKKTSWIQIDAYIPVAPDELAKVKERQENCKAVLNEKLKSGKYIISGYKFPATTEDGADKTAALVENAGDLMADPCEAISRNCPLEIKVILNDGRMTEVLKNQDVPVDVEIIDDDRNYEDHAILSAYSEQLFKSADFMPCNFTCTRFTQDEADEGEREGCCNTKISYMYRDAENNHVHNECVVAGCITDSMKEAILDSLDGAEYFIPSQVGLPERTFLDEGYDYDESIDHPWFELNEHGFEVTSDKPTVPMTVQELTAAFLVCKGKWEVL